MIRSVGLSRLILAAIDLQPRYQFRLKTWCLVRLQEEQCWIEELVVAYATKIVIRFGVKRT